MKLAYVSISFFSAALLACEPMSFTCKKFGPYQEPLLRINCVEGSEEAVLSTLSMPVTYTVTDFESVPLGQSLQVIPLQKTKTKVVGIEALKTTNIAFKNSVERKSIKFNFDHNLSTALMMWDVGSNQAKGFFVDGAQTFTNIDCAISE